MRRWLPLLAALALWALGGGAASAQAALDCSVVPQSVCQDEEILGLEGERSMLIEQLAGLDAQNAALAGEQTWIDGLSACGEDAACYRSAYLNHNQSLRQAIAALPGATVEPPLEAPPDAETTPPAESVEEALQPRRSARPKARDAGGRVYVPAGPPGWGFFTAIGVTLLIFYWLLRTRAKHLRETRADEARLRDEWR